MSVIPKLNLNDNYRDIEDYSLVGSMNMMVGHNNYLTTEYGIDDVKVITNYLNDYYKVSKNNIKPLNFDFGNLGGFVTSNYEIIHVIPCNTELVLFVKDIKIIDDDNTALNNTLDIFRYNEEVKECKHVINNFEYSGGKLLGDFTYNKNNLIIIVSEYFEDDSKKIPLRTINLGNFNKDRFVDNEDNKQLVISDLHSLCPKVRIPNVSYNIVVGNAQKGWHFIFVRYKISNNTYTRWFSTNESIFLDTNQQTRIADYRYSSYWEHEETNADDAESQHRCIMEMSISNEKDLSDYTYILTINDLDTKYDYYQVGIICINKGDTKGFISNDINIGTNVVKFINFKTHAVSDLLTSYYNYYNVKSLQVFNNRTYIGNYKEFEEELDTNNIEVNISARYTRPFVKYDDVETISTDLENIDTINTRNLVNEAVELYSNDIIDGDITGQINPDSSLNYIKINDVTINNESAKFVRGVFSCLYNNNIRDNVKNEADWRFTRYTEDREIISLIFSLKEEYQSADKLEPVDRYNNHHLVYSDYSENIGFLIGYELHYEGNNSYTYIPIQGSNARSLCIWNNGVPIAPWLKFAKDSPDNLLTNSFVANNGKSFRCHGRLYLDTKDNYRNWLSVSFKTDYVNDKYNSNIEFANEYSVYRLEETLWLGLDLILYNTGANQFVNTDLVIDGNTQKILFGDVITLKNDKDGKLFPSRIRYSNNNIDFEDNPISICNFEMQWFVDAFGGEVGNDIVNIPNDDNSIPPEDVADPETLQPIKKYKTEIGKLLSAGLSLNEYYSFYIHFVNEYGETSKGYPISMFNYSFNNESTDNTKESVVELDKTNNILKGINNDLLIIKDDSDYLIYDSGEIDKKKYYLTFEVPYLPKGYIAYFISCEKINKTLIYSGFLDKTSSIDNTKAIYRFYNDIINYDDFIDFSFTHIKVHQITESPTSVGTGTIVYNSLTNQTISEDIAIVSKKIVVADQINNVCNGSYIELELQKDIDISDGKLVFAHLINRLDEFKYAFDEKNLVPCSQLSYNNKPVIANPKTVFISNVSAIKYFGYLYDTATKVFKKFDSKLASTYPFKLNLATYKNYIPTESINFNNKPQIVIVPTKGLNSSEDAGSKFAYVPSTIVEAKNSIDLFQQKHHTYDNANPIVLNYYNKSIKYTDNFPNTIRRSNPIQDESERNAWREFNIEQYKIITENKGDVVKIFGLGNYFYVHTKHSLFYFRDIDSIKSKTNSDISLASIDIWDVKYHELFNSKNGFGGINKETHGIFGTFGYIWYSADDNHIYNLDKGLNLNVIDKDIYEFIKAFNVSDIKLVHDIHNYRILMNIDSKLITESNNTRSITLSYNYTTNTFISFHDYNFNAGYSTKNNIYLTDTSKLYTFNELFKLCGDGLANRLNSNINHNYFKDKAYIDVICNTSYPIIKFIEHIKYKIKNIEYTDIESVDFYPGINKHKYESFYSGDIIRIFNEYCDTGNLDVSVIADMDKIEKNTTSLNKVTKFNKPVFNLGYWDFNYIRNNVTNYEPYGNSWDDRLSRVFGNYFIIRFIFNNKNVEIENVICNTTNDV